MRLSATRIKTYLMCPRRYRYTYIDEIPVIPTGPVTFGRVMHQTLYFLHQAGIQRNASLNLEAAFSEFDRLWREALEQEQPLFKEGRNSAQEYWDLADDILRRYIALHQDAPAPFAVEFPFEVEWQGHTLAGVIDRIDEVKDGLVIVDYKTSQKKPSPQVLRDDLQLTIYALAVEQMLGQPVASIVHYHLRDQTMLSTIRDRSDFRRLARTVLPHLARPAERVAFPPRYGYWCRFCDHRELCQAEGPESKPPQTRTLPLATSNDGSLLERSLEGSSGNGSSCLAVSVCHQEQPKKTVPSTRTQMTWPTPGAPPEPAVMPHARQHQSGNDNATLLAAGVTRPLTPAQQRAISILITRSGLSAAEVQRLLQARFSQRSVEQLNYTQAASLLLELQRKLREKIQASRHPDEPPHPQ